MADIATLHRCCGYSLVRVYSVVTENSMCSLGSWQLANGKHGHESSINYSLERAQLYLGFISRTFSNSFKIIETQLNCHTRNNTKIKYLFLKFYN